MAGTIVARALALHAAYLLLNPNTPYGPQSSSGSDPWAQSQEWPPNTARHGLETKLHTQKNRRLDNETGVYTVEHYLAVRNYTAMSFAVHGWIWDYAGEWS